MNKRKLGAIASYIYSAAQVVVNLVYVPLLLSGIGQSEYGLFQMIGSVIAYLNVINSTISAGATRFYSKYYVLHDEAGMANTLGLLRKIYHKANLLIAGVSVALIWLVRIIYADSFSQWELLESNLLIVVLALNLAVTMNNTLSIAVISAHEEFVFLRLSLLAATIIQPLIVIVAIHFLPYALTVCVVQLLVNSGCRMVQQLYAKRSLGMDTKLRFYDKSLERDLLSFSGSIVLALVADQIFWKTDQLVLGYYFGTSTVAVYSVGSQVVSAYMPLGVTVASVFLPKISQLWHGKHDLDALSELFIKVSRIALYPCLAVLIGFIVFGRDFVRLWAGPGFDDAYYVAAIVLMPFTVDVVQNIGLTILQVMNRYNFRAKMYIVAALINIVLTLFLAKQFGCVGAAFSSGIAIIVSSGLILNWYYAKVIGLKMRLWWKSIIFEALPLVGIGVLAGFGKLLLPATAGWTQLVASILIYAVTFTAAAYFFSANEYERNLVKGIMHKILHPRF